jgi:hypothetical protein
MVSIACPLRVDGTVIGALAIDAQEPDAFNDDEVRLLTESADDLASGISSLRARAAQALAEIERFQLTHTDALTGLANGTFFCVVAGPLEYGVSVYFCFLFWCCKVIPSRKRLERAGRPCIRTGTSRNPRALNQPSASSSVGNASSINCCGIRMRPLPVD